MFLYAFNLYAGYDRVFKYQGLEKKFNFSAGDLVLIQEQYFLVLGEEISFQELYGNIPTINGVVQVVQKSFLYITTLTLLHWMVYKRYTTYKSVMKLFLSKDIATLLRKQTKTKKNTIYKDSILEIGDEKYGITKTGQHLVIFPDLWTLYTTFSVDFLAQDHIAIIHAQSSQNQKDHLWWDIKMGNKQLLITTHSQIFQDFKNLIQIIQIEPHQRYYANQKDPRYKTQMVFEKIKKLRGIKK